MKPIIVVGTGTTAYMTVAYVHKYLPNSIVWYKPDSPSIGVGEATTPTVMDFLKKIDIQERDVITEMNGTLKLGIHFKDFLYEGHSFYHPFSTYEDELAINYELMKDNCVLDDFSNTQAVHFDVNLITDILDKRFESFDRLTITSEMFEYNNSITDSIILDCSGFARAVVKQMPDFEFIDLSDRMSNNQAYVFRHEYTNETEQKKPYTIIKATDEGWIWHIPLKDKIGIGYVHNNQFEDTVLKEYTEYLSNYFNKPITKEMVRKVKMTSGRNNKAIFEHNTNTVIGIGLSTSFIEPMESTGLFFTCNDIISAVDVIKGETSVEEHNTKSNYNFDSTVNFIVLHYVHTTRTSEYWEFYKQLDPKTYTHMTNGCWHELSWKTVTDGLFGGQEEYKVQDIRTAIHYKKHKTDYATFELDLDKYILKSNVDK